jgi:hypothetical protein
MPDKDDVLPREVIGLAVPGRGALVAGILGEMGLVKADSQDANWRSSKEPSGLILSTRLPVTQPPGTGGAGVVFLKAFLP